MRIPQRLALLSSLLLTAGLLLTFVPASPAFAATTSPASTSAVHQVTGNGIAPAASALVQVAPNVKSVGPGGNAILCVNTVDLGLANGNVIAQGEIQCSGPTIIFVSLLLYRNGSLYASSTQTKAGTYYVYRDIVRRCSSSSHNWQVYLTGGVTFPAGYQPQSVAVSVGTANPRLHC
jgi:hypothetical protein